jgi:hypothetical protein
MNMLYKVANYTGVNEQITALVERAAAAGIRHIVIAALKEMAMHLQTHPLHWGDPEFGSNLPGVVCHAVLDPIIVRYMVIEEKQVVIVRQVKPLPGSLFDRS